MQYKTEQLSLAIGSYSINIERITNIDELFSELIAKGNDHEDVKDERIPYWAELWPSALALSHYMVEMDINWKEKTVLEIGCGLGLPGVLAGKLGAKEVNLTDYLAEAVNFAEANWHKNNSSKASFTTLDWRKPNTSLAADIVIAADIAYEKRSFDYLIPAFKTLCKKNGIILLSEPNRAFAKSFLQNLHNQGFKIKEHQTKQSLFDVLYTINIFEILELNKLLLS